ncbi:nitrile hydratase subunit beta [Mycolicibacterium sp. P9-64]|uniref:nitrile hydratase subunit beta n=1 Tax=Mycolicibacterium sp. P9-64 TaxID=2024612 RepID=UPI0011ECB21D|nr:nitrile hydratase subunit beta [Mycolicibacterium sp. P9-64]KAA0075537.1 nitrile hydratase subunit beta [Mycolicibacterium sp. P9-64]
MNGAQDMGGQMGFGPIEAETDEPTFHADWEARVLGLTIAMGAARAWNVDMGRAARESLPPAEYLSSSYYQIWLRGLQKLLVQSGLVTQDELDAGRSLAPGRPGTGVLKPDNVQRVLTTQVSNERPAATPARFTIGDAVVTRNMHPLGHTRLPRYARAKRGIVERIHGAQVFADAQASGRGEEPQWLYTVRFTGAELWGDDADPTVAVSIDAWESYLEAG